MKIKLENIIYHDELQGMNIGKSYDIILLNDEMFSLIELKQKKKNLQKRNSQLILKVL
jgi:hypothetical protein